MKMNTLRNALLLSTIMALTGQSAFAQSDPPRAGTVDLVTGKVSISNHAGVASQPVKGTIISPGDTIETAASGELHVKMEDGGYLAIRPNTAFKIERYVANGDSSDIATFSLLRGALRSLTGWIGKLNPKGYRLTTPTATIGIRGTDHETVHIPLEDAKTGEMPGTHDRVNHGATFLETPQGRLEIAEGRAGYVTTATGDTSKGMPTLHASIPKFLIERRTSNDTVADRYYSEIGEHIRKKMGDRKRPAATERNEDDGAARKSPPKEERLSSGAGQEDHDRPRHAPRKRKP
jgi:hypothetical protein